MDYPPFVVATNFAKNPVTAKMERVVLPFCSAFEIEKSTDVSEKASGFVFSSKFSWLDTITVFNPLQNFTAPANMKKGPFALGVILTGKKRRLIVVGTSRFVDSSVSQDPSNSAFFMNIADWLASDEALIEIRGKGTVYRPLKKISRAGEHIFKYANLFGNSLILLILGLFVWRKNVSMREYYRRIYE